MLCTYMRLELLNSRCFSTDLDQSLSAIELDSWSLNFNRDFVAVSHRRQPRAQSRGGLFLTCAIFLTCARGWGTILVAD